MTQLALRLDMRDVFYKQILFVLQGLHTCGKFFKYFFENQFFNKILNL